MASVEYNKFHRAVAWVEFFQRSSTRFIRNRTNPQQYIDRMRVLMEHLGNPQNAYDVIHVAGTAGKGTVATMLANILTASGKRTGLYTSPYCITPIENVAVDGRYISPAQFCTLVEKFKPIVALMRPTPLGAPSTFELMTAIAFVYFQRQGCDWVVLEAGLGGRYDATNVVEHSRVCVVTTIGLDHTQVLGHTAVTIARDKAGIVKPGSHVFTNASQSSVVKLLRAESARQHALFHAPQQPLINTHLAQRIGTLLKFSRRWIKKGINSTQLPCRQEWVEPAIMLDGAHSPIKMRHLCSMLPKPSNGSRRIVIIGIANDKNKEGILRFLLPHIDVLIVTPFMLVGWGDRRCAPARDLAVIARRIRPSLVPLFARNPQLALKKARALAHPNDTIIVTGSFYLVGQLRRQWYSEEFILQRRRSF